MSAMQLFHNDKITVGRFVTNGKASKTLQCQQDIIMLHVNEGLTASVFSRKWLTGLMIGQ